MLITEFTPTDQLFGINTGFNSHQKESITSPPQVRERACTYYMTTDNLEESLESIGDVRARVRGGAIWLIVPIPKDIELWAAQRRFLMGEDSAMTENIKCTIHYGISQ